jgi:uncharacterized protein (DUF1684 family)
MDKYYIRIHPLSAVRRPVRNTAALNLSAAIRAALILTVLTLAFANLAQSAGGPPQKWLDWQAKRHESIAGTNGWATIIGLHWLDEGTNRIGSGPDAKVKFPSGRAAEFVGDVVKIGKLYRFQTAPGGQVTLDGTNVTLVDLTTDEGTNKPTKLHLGDFTFYVIQRGEKAAVRIKDPQAETRTHFLGLDYFPYRTKWRLEGKYEPYPKPIEMPIIDITGNHTKEESPGRIAIKIAGKEFHLEAIDDKEEKDLWIVFRDASAGKSTYGAGRFLHLPYPVEGQPVIVDFNYAYSPPCAFTPFATCPLPPQSNRFPMPIEAGEKKYKGGH